MFLWLAHGTAAEGAPVTVAYAAAACDDLFRQVRRGAPMASAAISAPPIPALPTTAPRPPPAAAAPCQSMVDAQQVLTLCPWSCEVAQSRLFLC